MSKSMKLSPPEKRVKKFGMPAITRHENDMWKDLTTGTVEKYNRVQIVSTPSIVSEAFRANYDSVFGKKKL